MRLLDQLREQWQGALKRRFLRTKNAEGEALPPPLAVYRQRSTGETVEGLLLTAPLCVSFGAVSHRLVAGDLVVDLGAEGVRIILAEELARDWVVE